MRLTSYDCKLTEVFVERDENSIFVMGQGHDLVIAGIRRPVSGPENIVPCGLQWTDGATPNAAIEQKFHEADSRGSGSIRS